MRPSSTNPKRERGRTSIEVATVETRPRSRFGLVKNDRERGEGQSGQPRSKNPPHPRPLSPEYRGEGRLISAHQQSVDARAISAQRTTGCDHLP